QRERLLDARVDEIETRDAATAVERLHVDGRTCRETEATDADLAGPWPPCLVLQVARHLEAVRQTIDQLRFRDHRPIADNQPVGMDEVVLAALTCAPAAHTTESSGRAGLRRRST